MISEQLDLRAPDALVLLRAAAYASERPIDDLAHDVVTRRLRFDDHVGRRLTMAARSDRLARTFVDVADTLVADFDIVDFLTVLTVRCVELFNLAAAGLVLSDSADGVRVAASSNDRMQLLELFELQYDEGPCLDSYRSGERVRCDDLATVARPSAGRHSCPRRARRGTRRCTRCRCGCASR